MISKDCSRRFASILSQLLTARKRPPGSRSQSVPRPARDDPLSPREQLERVAESRRVRGWDPRPTLRANFFPEVTDSFCGLPKY
ncbi:Unknown protein [Striga hermonthica]|uniref:Uncharacterized protein n=1 Tax=Striga hermonthica TaxID=68872 RepID=A0A9N7NI06_STRHE|nr:Unknown protein [Striga hermonthica]